MTHRINCYDVVYGPVSWAPTGIPCITETLTTGTTNITPGTLQPDTSGAQQCVYCGLWFDTGPMYYVDMIGPICPFCRTTL